MESLKPQDVTQINESGRSMAYITHLIRVIKQGKSYLKLVEPATAENGRVIRMTEKDFGHLEAIWKREVMPEAIKFVPASGAASRMFRALKFVLSSNHKNAADVSERLKALEKSTGRTKDEDDEYKNLTDFMKFWNNLKGYPFYEELVGQLKGASISIEKEISSGNIKNILNCLLTKEGMNYSAKPKLLLTFHIDDGCPRLAMEEHIKEAIWLTGGRLHFTVPPDYLEAAKKLAEYFTKKYAEQKFALDISFSIQDPMTDAVAMNLDGSDLHRNPDGSIFFRQSGHGALSFNLNKIESSYVLVQNVDNLPGGSDEILRWKRAFMGLFKTIQDRIHVLARGLSNKDAISEDLVNESFKYVTEEIKRPIDHKKFASSDLNEKAKVLFNSLNRPFVLAAMVPNTGEPGGGPFVTKDPATGIETNQIVEGAQQDHSDPIQHRIAMKATHFNPVFLIVGTRDAWGKKFDLSKYAKKEGGYVFYVEKSDDYGKKFASVDTGLWNGEIAGMTIMFAEMPLFTFGPAKTVLDLSPEIRPFRKNAYPEILPNISHEEVLKIMKG